MGNVKLPRQGELDLVDAMVALADYVGAKLHLFKNDINPNEDTLLADFVECDFDGYAAPTVTWSAAYDSPEGLAVSSGGEKLFVQDDVLGNNVYGAYLTNTAGTLLLRSCRFTDAPFPLAIAGDTLPVLIKIGLMDGLVDPSPAP